MMYGMIARAHEAAATVQVLKSESILTASDANDRGTTEGDVYLFMRAVLPAMPLEIALDQTRHEWVISPKNDLPASENTVHAWVVHPKDADAVLSRRLRLAAMDGKVLPTRTSALVDDAEASTGLALNVQLNEALVGNGLRPDEAAVLSRLTLKSLEGVENPVLVYLVPQQWTDKMIPLEIEGPAERPLRIFVGIAALHQRGDENRSSLDLNRGL